MKIFQPIVSGSFTTSGSVFLKGLTSAAQSNIILIDTASGQLYTTASSALGGGGGGSAFPYTGSAQITGSLIVTGSTTSTQGFIKPGAGSQYLLADGTTTAGTGGSVFPYTGSALITGSLGVTGPTTVTADFGFNVSNTALTVGNNTLSEEGGESVGIGVAGYGSTGVFGQTGDGIGVWGIANGTSAIGVRGQANNPGAIGVLAVGDIGLYTSGSTTAIEAIGPVNITGNTKITGLLYVTSSQAGIPAITAKHNNTDGSNGYAIHVIGNGSNDAMYVDGQGGSAAIRTTGTDSGILSTASDTAFNATANVGLYVAPTGDRGIELPLANEKVGIQANSYVDATGDILNFTKDAVETFKVNHLGEVTAPSFTGSLFGTASYATNALTASYIIGGGEGAAFPYTGNAQITGSLLVTSTLQLDGSLTDFATVNSTIVGSNNLYTQATGSHTSAFVKYAVSKGTNSRAGEFIANWNGTSVTYFDNSTTDIGNTSDIVFSSAIVSSQIQVNATAATSGWKIKTLATFI